MNISIISGRVSKEIKVNTNGKTGYFTLANDRDYPFNKDKNGNKVSNFIQCKVLGEKNIERVQKWLTKGTAIIVTGHYFRDSWKTENEFKELNYILVEKWEFQIGKQSEEQSASDSEATESGQSTSQEQTSEPPKAPDDFMDINSDEILDSLPFR